MLAAAKVVLPKPIAVNAGEIVLLSVIGVSEGVAGVTAATVDDSSSSAMSWPQNAVEVGVVISFTPYQVVHEGERMSAHVEAITTFGETLVPKVDVPHVIDAGVVAMQCRAVRMRFGAMSVPEQRVVLLIMSPMLNVCAVSSVPP